MINVIVSNNAIEYKGFLKVNKLSEVDKITGDINCLVYHKSNESQEDKVTYLTQLKERVTKFIYIRNKEDCDKAVKMVVVGSGGKYLDDEFFLESYQELNNLISNMDEVTALAEMSGVSVVGEFFNRYLKDGSSGFNKEYLLIVKKAVAGMVADYKKKDLELLQMSETATELFAHTATLISKVEEERNKLKESVQKLQEAKENIITAPVSSSAPNILFFPTVSYLKDKNIIRIKEIGNFPRLTSFSLGMRLYYESIKYLKPKIIFIMPVGDIYNKLYQDFHWVTQFNSNTMDGYYNNIVFTNYPTKEVLFRLLDDTDYDTFIVIDRLKSNEKHILNCKGTVKYAISSISFANILSIKPLVSFFPKEKSGTLFSIGYDDTYPEEIEQRERYYLREYSFAYDILYSIKKG